MTYHCRNLLNIPTYWPECQIVSSFPSYAFVNPLPSETVVLPYFSSPRQIQWAEVYNTKNFAKNRHLLLQGLEPMRIIRQPFLLHWSMDSKHSAVKKKASKSRILIIKVLVTNEFFKLRYNVINYAIHKNCARMLFFSVLVSKF